MILIPRGTALTFHAGAATVTPDSPIITVQSDAVIRSYFMSNGVIINVRVPHLGGWEIHDVPGYKIVLTYGIDGKSAMVVLTPIA